MTYSMARRGRQASSISREAPLDREELQGPLGPGGAGGETGRVGRMVVVRVHAPALYYSRVGRPRRRRAGAWSQATEPAGRVAELADALDLGSRAARREGSSPSPPKPLDRVSSPHVALPAFRSLFRTRGEADNEDRGRERLPGREEGHHRGRSRPRGEGAGAGLRRPRPPREAARLPPRARRRARCSSATSAPRSRARSPRRSSSRPSPRRCGSRRSTSSRRRTSPSPTGVAEGKPLRYTARVEVKPKLSTRRTTRGLEVTRQPPVGDRRRRSPPRSRRSRSRWRSSCRSRAGSRPRRATGRSSITRAPSMGSRSRARRAEGVTVQVAPGAVAEGNLEAARRARSSGRRWRSTSRSRRTTGNEALRGKVAKMTGDAEGAPDAAAPALDDALAKCARRRGGRDARAAARPHPLGPREARGAPRRERAARRPREGGPREERVRGPARARRARHRRDDRGGGGAVRPLRASTSASSQLDYARMRADLREQALLQVRGRLLLEAIADAEKVDVTDEDLQAEVTRLAGRARRCPSRRSSSRCAARKRARR